MNSVIVWTTEGQRREVETGRTLAQARGLAATYRIMQYRTVKIADALGCVYHWKRSTHLPRNHWVQMQVEPCSP